MPARRRPRNRRITKIREEPHRTVFFDTLTTARTATIASEGGLTIERANAMRRSVRETVAFYGDRVDFESLSFELETVTAQFASHPKHLVRLDDRIA